MDKEQYQCGANSALTNIVRVIKDLEADREVIAYVVDQLRLHSENARRLGLCEAASAAMGVYEWEAKIALEPRVAAPEGAR